MFNPVKGKKSTNPHKSNCKTSGKCFVWAWSSILVFYLTSYGDFLFQVKHSFLLLDQCAAFNMPQPRYHLRESQDLSVFEWEEMAGEFTRHATHLPFLCSGVRQQRLLSRHGFDLKPFWKLQWKLFRSLSLSPSPHENRAWSGPGPGPRLVGTAAQMIWALCRFYDSFSESTPPTWASTFMQPWFIGRALEGYSVWCVQYKCSVQM